MISYSKGEVTQILTTYNGCTEIKVRTNSGEHRAINYHLLTGDVKPGDKVLLNTTAVQLGLGSGGYHFVVSKSGGSTISPDQVNKATGHIMKLRYTPLQFSVLSIEEENSPYHKLFHEFKNLNNMPVLIGELHSMLVPAVFNIKRKTPTLKVAYIMTDGGALPANFSRNVNLLKTKGLIEGTITFGQAFGGDYEAVNVYTALIGAKAILKSDIAVITMGPGITGTGTKYGFSGIEQGYIIDAVNTLGGRPIFMPRISFADPRLRHQGLSHHSITVLKEIVQTKAEVVLPQMTTKKCAHVRAQLETHGIHEQHKIVLVSESEEVLKNIRHFGVKLTTMGRTLDHDREFFLTAGSAGYYAANLS